MSTYRQATSTVMAFGGGEVLKAIWDLKELNICTFPRPSTCASQVYVFTRKKSVMFIAIMLHQPL